jgi:hypothetical protein
MVDIVRMVRMVCFIDISKIVGLIDMVVFNFPYIMSKPEKSTEK